MFKNVASQKIILIAFDSTTGAPKTGDAGNITAYVSKDGGSVTVLGDTSATEMDATNAKGAYIFDLTQAETNADMLLFTAKSSTANIYLDPVLAFTAPANFSALSIDSNGRGDIIKIAGTTQTARDIGASVLLSSGTGTGQVKLSSGYVAPNWGDVGNPTTVVGLSGTTVKTATDVETDTQDIQGRLPAALVSGRMDSSTGAMASDVLTAAALAASAVAEIQSGLSTLDAAGIRAAIGLASANLDTQLAALAAYIDTEIAAIKAKTDNLPSDPADASDIAAAFASIASTLSSISSAILTAAAIRSAIGLASANLDTQLAALLAALPRSIRKNTQLANFEFPLVLSSDHVTGATGKTVTATRSIDGGAFASCANSVTEVANGVYKITLAAADLNGDTVTLRFTAAACDDRIITIVTQP